MFGAHEAAKALVRELRKHELRDVPLPEPYFAGWPLAGAFHFPEVAAQPGGMTPTSRQHRRMG